LRTNPKNHCQDKTVQTICKIFLNVAQSIRFAIGMTFFRIITCVKIEEHSPQILDYLLLLIELDLISFLNPKVQTKLKEFGRNSALLIKELRGLISGLDQLNLSLKHYLMIPFNNCQNISQNFMLPC